MGNKRVTTECFDDREVLMTNKAKYAKLYSEGRESLEQLLLTCYSNNIMSYACCSGHINENEIASSSYLLLKPNSSNLGIITSIIDEYKNSDLNSFCNLEERISEDSFNTDSFDFVIRTNYYDADDVYLKIINIINNSHNKNTNIEYQVLELLKKELSEFRSGKVSNKNDFLFEAGEVEIVQANCSRADDGNFYPASGNFIEIDTSGTLLTSLDDIQRIIQKRQNPADIESLIKHINDNKNVNYTKLINRYKYEDDRQLEELRNVLIKKSN